MYTHHVIDGFTGQVVQDCASARAAGTAADRLNSKYGSHRYYPARVRLPMSA